MSWREPPYEHGKPDCGCGDGEGEGSTTKVRADRWWTHKEVLRHLRVDHRSLQKAMQQTQTHITKPWVNFGTGQKPRYRWQSAQIDAWWHEVHEWRASQRETLDTGSAGAIRTDRNAAGSARTLRRRGGSSGTSNGHTQKEDDGNLVTLVRSLTSGKS